ncbi:MAG: DNA cytosine methyltransferase [Pseudomonadota bacterium]
MNRPRLLDLFCGAGGAAMGYHRAGFDVVGVDIKPQKHYPFWFIQGDALKAEFDDFDAIHASPPCQAHSALRHLYPEKDYECFIDRIRERLVKWGGPYVIENVPGAPLRNPVMLCGSSFGLRVRRHRLFESTIPLKALPCNHKDQGRPIDVSGTGGRRVNRRKNDHGGNTNKPRSIEEARSAIGIDWADRYGISQAIPPAYTEWIGKQMMEAL